MKLAAAAALAELVGDDLAEDCVIPSPFDPRVGPAVAAAVAAAARRGRRRPRRPPVGRRAGPAVLAAIRRAPPSTPTTRCPASRSASDPSPSVPTAGRRSRSGRPRSTTTTSGRCAASGSSRGAAADDPRLRRGRGRRGRQRGRRARGHRRARCWARRRDLRPEALAALRASPGHARRAGRRAAAQPRAQAGRAVVRGGGVPADRVADGVPDALRRGRAARPATPCWCRAPAAGWRRRAIVLARAAGLRVWATSRDEAKRAQALELGAHEALRVRRAAARAGRRGDRDRRRGHLVALAASAAARRHGSSSAARRAGPSSRRPS